MSSICAEHIDLYLRPDLAPELQSCYSASPPRNLYTHTQKNLNVFKTEIIIFPLGHHPLPYFLIPEAVRVKMLDVT